MAQKTLNTKDDASGGSGELAQTLLREKSLDKIKSGGWNYPNANPTHRVGDILQKKYLDLTRDELTEQSDSIGHIRVCGRLVSRRFLGKVAFCDLADDTGKIQIFCAKDTVDLIKELDIGDVIQAQGSLFRTQVGELTIHLAADETAKSSEPLTLLAKCLMPFPDAQNSLKDVETRYRQRYLDMLANAKFGEVLQFRAKTLKIMRDILDAEGYIEVETPILHPIAGGATARPFTTFHNDIEENLYLRVAPELYLKRLLVGGVDRLYEINHNFRNEGASTKHNPEFSMLEFYCAYKDFNYGMEMTERIIKNVAKGLGSDTANLKFDKKDMTELVAKACGLSRNKVLDAGKKDKDTLTTLRKKLIEVRPDLKKETKDMSWGKLIFELFEAKVERRIQVPTFVTGHPIDVSPLARESDANPILADRWELFANGIELANGFSELNDPKEQESRLVAQNTSRIDGNDEAMYLDRDFINAMKYGMPPASGVGLGIDRLLMYLCGEDSIREVIAFPAQKRIEKDKAL